MTLVSTILLAAAPSPAAPSSDNANAVCRTRYGRACLRLEARPKPWEAKDTDALCAAEGALAEAGVGARWIQVVDNKGCPLVDNPFLPCPYGEKSGEHDELLKQWVAAIHDEGRPVMSWFAMTACESGNRAHPEWRQRWLGEGGAEVSPALCCINSGYGDALIEYATWAIGHFGLDGIWFDGTFWTPTGGGQPRPLRVSCACDACKARFLQDTGLRLPQRENWSDPAFRRWVTWRYRVFGEYLGRLARRIRSDHPEAAVVVNHYHRPGIPWHRAIPLDRYEADIITGSEAHSPETLDVTMRLCRAYGRPQAEVWRSLARENTPAYNAEPSLQHALICYAAGGFPSFGAPLFERKIAPTLALMAPVMRAVHPLVGGPSLPYAALHVSQQTETFRFGAAEGAPGNLDPYFRSLGA